MDDKKHKHDTPRKNKKVISPGEMFVDFDNIESSGDVNENSVSLEDRKLTPPNSIVFHTGSWTLNKKKNKSESVKIKEDILENKKYISSIPTDELLYIIEKSSDDETNLLGKGTYSEVYKVKIHEREYAIKLISFIKPKGNVVKVEWFNFNEISIMSSLIHPNLMYSYMNIIHNNTFYIIMPICSNFNIYESYSRKALDDKADPDNDYTLGISLSEKILSFYHCLMGLNILHKLSYIHRDIRADNIFKHCGFYKIADFGMSTFNKTEVKNRRIEYSYNYSLPREFIIHSSAFSDIYQLCASMFCTLFEFQPYAKVKTYDTYNKTEKLDKKKKKKQEDKKYIVDNYIKFPDPEKEKVKTGIIPLWNKLII